MLINIDWFRVKCLVCSFRSGRKNRRHLGCSNIMRSRGCAVQNKGRQGHVRSMSACYLVKISGISGSVVNRTRFVGSFHRKILRKSGKSKKVGPFSRLEFPNGISCSIYTFLVVCTSPRSTARKSVTAS